MVNNQTGTPAKERDAAEKNRFDNHLF